MRNLLLLLFVQGCLTGFSQQYESIALADDVLQQTCTEGYCVGIAAGFSVDGEVRWIGSAGYRDRDEQISFTPDTKNRIASISKPITAVAIMQLHEKKMLSLDTAIQTYLPNFPMHGDVPITVRQLLNHASGIAAYKNKKEAENQTHYDNLAAAIDIFKDRDLLSQPGEAFHYTTYGYVVLGRIIEVVSGMDYDAYVQTHIFNPLGMTNTGVEIFGNQYDQKSSLYDRSDNGKIKSGDPHDLSDRVPGGGFYSTIEDLLKFGNAVLNHTLIGEASTQAMFSDSGMKQEGNAYGLGWYLYGVNPSYGPVYGHNGSQIGASTFLMLLPDQKTAIAVLSNTSGCMQQVSNITINLFDIAANSGQ